MSKLYQQLQPTFQAIHEELDEQNERLAALEEGGTGGGSVGIPATVRAAIYNVLANNAYSVSGDFNSDLAIIEEWASSSCTDIVLSAYSLIFNTSTPRKLTATLIPADCEDVVYWTSSDDSVATVVDGLVSPISNGSCTITASVGSITAVCDVAVSGIKTRYTIAKALTDCTTSNNTVTVEDGDEYSAVITTNAGVAPSSISVTMGETDITSSVVNGSIISIPSVTGNVMITATMLPAGFTRFDYIKNTQTGDSVVIDTGLGPEYAGPDYGHEMTLKFTNTFATGTSALAGIRKTSGQSVSSRVIWQKSGALSVDYNGAGTGYVIPVEQNVKYVVKTENGVVYLNGDAVQSLSGNYSDFSVPRGLSLFGCGRDSKYDPMTDNFNIYKYTVADVQTGIYVAYLVPCTNVNDVPGVYDAVRQTFYTSSTPSNLVCGNE